MIDKKIFLIIFVLIFAFTFTVASQNISFDIKSMSGDSTYIIEGENHGGYKSKLKFPLDIPVLTIEYNFPLKKLSKLEKLNISLGYNAFKKDAGIMKDYDWLYSYQDDVTIYSESDAEISALLFDINMESCKLKFSNKYRFFSKLLIGYQHKNFDYNISNTVQQNKITDNTVKFTGKTLDYLIKYHIPYAGIKIARLQNKKISSCYLSLLYSPLVAVNDKDDHLMRDKISEIDADGSAVMLDGEISYRLRENLNLTGGIYYTIIKTEGTQLQKDYEGNILHKDIDAKIENEQLGISLGIEYVF